MPKVSVILTSYNHGTYLSEAIESVLGQTFSDFELIIWDDASSDNSWEIISQYADPRIKAFRNEERKRGAWGINTSITEVASGDSIAIHHSDDVWELDKLEKQVAFLDAHANVGAVFTTARIITEDGSALLDESHPYVTVFEQPNRTRHEWLRFFFVHGNTLCHPSVLIRKACYRACGVYRADMAQFPDFDMWVRLCLQYEIHVLPEKLVRFRVRNHEANSSGNRPDARMRQQYEFYKLLQNYRLLRTADDVIKVFPSAHAYDRQDQTDIEFALAMVALNEKPHRFSPLFGLDLLFEAMSDRERAARIKRLYGFDYKDFVALTGRYDIFAGEALAERDKQIAERDALINAIYATRSWKITRPLRALSRFMRRGSSTGTESCA